MKKIKKYLLLSTLGVLLMLFFNTCKKYDEGSWLRNSKKNLFGQKKDLSAKEWGLKLFEVNGIDSTELIAGASTIPDFHDHFVTFKIIHAKYSDLTASTFLYLHGGNIYEGNKTIYFNQATSNDTMQCNTKYNTFYCERNVFNPEKNTGTKWNIKKLTSNELIITVDLINSYKIVLKSK